MAQALLVPHLPGSCRSQPCRELGIWKAVSPTAAYLKPSSSLVVWGSLAWSPLISNDSIMPSLAFQEEEAGEQRGHQAGYWFRQPTCLRTGWLRRESWLQKRHCEAVKLATLHMQPCLQLLAWAQMSAQQDAPHTPQDSRTVTAGKSLCSPLFSLPFSICCGFCPAPAPRVAQPCKDLSSCTKRRDMNGARNGKLENIASEKPEDFRAKLVFRFLFVPWKRKRIRYEEASENKISWRCRGRKNIYLW